MRKLWRTSSNTTEWTGGQLRRLTGRPLVSDSVQRVRRINNLIKNCIYRWTFCIEQEICCMRCIEEYWTLPSGIVQLGLFDDELVTAGTYSRSNKNKIYVRWWRRISELKLAVTAVADTETAAMPAVILHPSWTPSVPSGRTWKGSKPWGLDIAPARFARIFPPLNVTSSSAIAERPRCRMGQVMAKSGTFLGHQPLWRNRPPKLSNSVK